MSWLPREKKSQSAWVGFKGKPRVFFFLGGSTLLAGLTRNTKWTTTDVDVNFGWGKAMFASQQSESIGSIVVHLLMFPQVFAETRTGFMAKQGFVDPQLWGGGLSLDSLASWLLARSM